MSWKGDLKLESRRFRLWLLGMITWHLIKIRGDFSDLLYLKMRFLDFIDPLINLIVKQNNVGFPNSNFRWLLCTMELLFGVG
jgi:hypothetical protein